MILREFGKEIKMKLEKEMYVRTKKGLIAKIINIFDDENIMKICGKIQTEKFGLNENEILKASHNIIDLIEVGDIVTTKHLGLEKEYIEVINNETSLEILKSYFKEKSLELISVVTKQAFESMQYEVK